MNKRFPIGILLLLASILCLKYRVKAQSGAINEVPFQILTIFKCPYYLNSSLSGTTSSKEASVLYSGRAGLFSNVRTVGFYGFSNLHELKTDSSRGFKHFVGVWAMSIQDGELFRKNRIMIAYSPSIPIGKGDLSTSLKVGLASYSFQSTDYSSGGADSKTTLDLSAAYKKPLWTIAVGAHDFSNGYLMPVEEKYFLNRYYSFLFKKDFRLRFQDRIELNTLHFHFPEASVLVHQISLSYCWKSKFSLGGFYNTYTQSTGGMLSIEKIQVKQSIFRIHACYRTPSFTIAGSRFNHYELMLVYGFETFRKNSVLEDDSRNRKNQLFSRLTK